MTIISGIGYLAYLPPLNIKYEEYYEKTQRSTAGHWIPWHASDSETGIIEGLFISTDKKVSRFSGSIVRPPLDYDPIDCGLCHTHNHSSTSHHAHDLAGFPIFYSLKLLIDDVDDDHAGKQEFIVEQVALSSHQNQESSLTETGDALVLRSFGGTDQGISMTFDTETVYAYEKAQNFLQRFFSAESKLLECADTLVLIGNMEYGSKQSPLEANRTNRHKYIN